VKGANATLMLTAESEETKIAKAKIKSGDK